MDVNKFNDSSPADPTHNVRELVALQVKRIDDLSAANEKRTDDLRAMVIAANERAVIQANLNTTQVANSAEALRILVAATAAAAATQQTQLLNPITEKIRELEKAQNENAGKGRVADPMITNLMAEVKKLGDYRESASGTNKGMDKIILYILTGGALIIYALSHLH